MSDEDWTKLNLEDALPRLHSNDGALTHLNLRNQRIKGEGARELAEALRENNSLAGLDLWNNEIGDSGPRALADALKENKTLTGLHLGKNGIRDEGARALAEALKKNKSLAKLVLRKNGIGDRGARALAEALNENETLANLSFYNNGIRDEGARALAEALKKNETLAELDLRSNRIGDKGARALAEALEKNKSLKELHLRNNTIGVEGVRALAEALKGNESLANLNLINNKIGDKHEEVRALVEALKVKGNCFKCNKSASTFHRYLIEEESKYKSATCTVHFAIDNNKAKGKEGREVAIKIMENNEQFQGELERRLFSRPGSGMDIDPRDNRFHREHAVPLLRYHEEKHGREVIRCLVMPRGERNVDEILRYEGFAGRDVNKIVHVAVDIAKALQHMHTSHRVHGDFKPRNIVRIHGNFKLIDFGASVGVGDKLTERFSSGYLPPEVAKIIFCPRESQHDLEIQLKDVEEKVEEARKINNSDKMLEEMARLKEDKDTVKTKMAQLDDDENHRKGLVATTQLDVWSYGVVMYEMLTGEPLFRCDKYDNLMDEKDQQELINWGGITDNKLRLVLKDSVDRSLVESAKSFLRECLSVFHERFHNFDQVLDSPFLNGKVLQLQDFEEDLDEMK